MPSTVNDMKPILSLCLFQFTLQALAQESGCPEKYPMESLKVSPLPKGWVSVTPQGALLDMVDFMYGPPVDPGFRLKGDPRKIRNGSEESFDLSMDQPEGKWKVCRYGILALAKRLPDGIQSCVVRYTKKNEYAPRVDISVSCSTRPLEPTAPEPRNARRKH